VIEVVISNGDSAEAETPEEAVYAAQVLIREAQERGTYYSRPTASFFVDGRLVRERVSLADLGLLALSNRKAA
jgi:hypothetical protein